MAGKPMRYGPRFGGSRAERVQAPPSLRGRWAAWHREHGGYSESNERDTAACFVCRGTALYRLWVPSQKRFVGACATHKKATTHG
jgi:hypothetical protein